ncbi:MAG: Ku protein [Acidobacteria bacterium]|nr:Ku protein [Acidobacteriota bacterium]
MASSVWKGHLTFGLVALPVRLFSAARGQTVNFNMLHKSDHSRIKQVIYCQHEDKAVPRSELVKGYEYEKDRYVVVEDDEIKAVAPKTSKVMEILEFVEAKDVDPIYLESSYYMAPEEGGEKPYALLFEALRKSGYYGVAKIAMHNREHIVILRPGQRGILLHTMYYADEIRKVDEFRTDTAIVSEKEMNLAMMLVQSLADKFAPEKYKDSYRENLEIMIQTKLAGRKVVEIASPPVAPVIDIMEALKKSLEAKKPMTVASQAAAEEEGAGKVKKAAGRKRG